MCLVVEYVQHLTAANLDHTKLASTNTHVVIGASLPIRHPYNHFIRIQKNC